MRLNWMPIVHFETIVQAAANLPLPSLAQDMVYMRIGRWSRHWFSKRGYLLQAHSNLKCRSMDLSLTAHVRLIRVRYYVPQGAITTKGVTNVKLSVTSL